MCHGVHGGCAYPSTLADSGAADDAAARGFPRALVSRETRRGDCRREVCTLRVGYLAVGSGPSFTCRLPKFSPLRRPMKAAGAFSMPPSTMSSLYLMRPERTHSPICLSAGPYRMLKSQTMKPRAVTRLPTKVPIQRGPGSAVLYWEMEPQRLTRAWKLRFASTASLTCPPTLSKYTSTPFGQAAFTAAARLLSAL